MSGRRNIVAKFQAYLNQDSTVPAPSKSSDTSMVDVCKYTLVVDASVKCLMTVQFADEKDAATKVWRNLSGMTDLTVDGSVDTQYTLLLKEHACINMRLNFTNNAGTGVINAWYSAVNEGA